MTPTHLQQWIQHPETLNRDTLYELRTLVARYPYFQSLRLLYLKNLYLLHDINFGAELRKAVLYVADRRVLFYFIEGDRYTLKSQKVSSLFSGDSEKEPSVDRTLSMTAARVQVAFSKKSVVLRTPIIWLDDEKPDARPPPLEF